MRIKTNLILLIVFISQLALGTLIPAISGKGVSDYYMMFLTQLIPIFIPSVLYLWFHKAGFKAIKRDKMINIADLLVIIILSFAVNIVVNHFLCMPIYKLFQSSSGAQAYTHTGFEFVSDIFVICIIPAMFEEVLFRGIAFSEYEKIYGTKKAIIFCAVVFSLMHGSMVAIIPQFLIGLYLTYIVFRTNSLYAGVIGHFVINLTTLLMQNASTDADAFLRGIISGNQIAVFVICTLISAVGLWLIGKMHKTNKYKLPTLNQKEIQVEKNFFKLLVVLFVCIQLLTFL